MIRDSGKSSGFKTIRNAKVRFLLTSKNKFLYTSANA